MANKKFLIVKIGALGDIFYALPAVDFLRQSFPNFEIDWLVGAALAPILQAHPAIHKIVSLDAQAIYHGDFWQRLKQVKQARHDLQNRYDQIFLLHRSAAYLPILLGKGPITQMSRERDFSFLGVQGVKSPPLRQHESLAIRKTMIAGLQKSSESHNWESLPWHADLTYLRCERVAVPAKGRLLGMHWGGGQNTANEFTLKTWPYWQDLLAILLRNTDLRLRVVGGPSEVQEINLSPDLQTAAQGRLENRIGKTTLKELAKEISECDYFIGPDSGPLHIADAFAIPSVGIYGPTSQVSWGLLTAQSKCLAESVPCHPCYQDDGIFPPCPNKKICMTQMPAEKVWHAVQALTSKP